MAGRGDLQAGAPPRHDEQAQVRAAAGRADQEVRGGGIRDEHLAAIQGEALQRGLRVELHGAGSQRASASSRARVACASPIEMRERYFRFGGIAGRIDATPASSTWKDTARAGGRGHFFERATAISTKPRPNPPVLFIEK